MKWNNKSCNLPEDAMAIFPSIMCLKLLNFGRPDSSIFKSKIRKRLESYRAKLPMDEVNQFIGWYPDSQCESFQTFGSVELHFEDRSIFHLPINYSLYNSIFTNLQSGIQYNIALDIEREELDYSYEVIRENRAMNPIFVFDFTTHTGQINGLTSSFTEDFEKALIDYKKALTESEAYYRVNRKYRFTPLFERGVPNEKVISNFEEIPYITLNRFKKYGVNIIIFGQIYDFHENDYIEITVTLLNLDGKILSQESSRYPREKLYSPYYINEAMKKMVNKIFPTILSLTILANRSCLGDRIHSGVNITGSLSLGIAAINFVNKANDEKANIPNLLSEEKLIRWGKYKKFQTRNNMYGLTALHLAISALPSSFRLLNINIGHKINKWSLASLFLMSSSTFTIFGAISGNKADNAHNKLITEYNSLSENKVIYWGKYLQYREREKVFYMNAVIDLFNVIYVLLWYDQDNKTSKLPELHLGSNENFKLSLDVGYDKT